MQTRGQITDILHMIISYSYLLRQIMHEKAKIIENPLGRASLTFSVIRLHFPNVIEARGSTPKPRDLHMNQLSDGIRPQILGYASKAMVHPESKVPSCRICTLQKTNMEVENHLFVVENGLPRGHSPLPC